ncbi:MAG: hypothetical protein Q8Q29_07415 [Actinomycetota bacterium]|nr:hypothetical protein [Actinomycetota bacterium]
MPRYPTQPDPEFLVDRSLGLYVLPDALRARGLTVHTLESVYGKVQSQSVPDIRWLGDAGQNNWVVLCKDDSIRRTPMELATVERYRVKMFCLTTASLTGEQQRDRILSHVNRIAQRARKPGPYIYGIYERNIRLLWRPAES